VPYDFIPGRWKPAWHRALRRSVLLRGARILAIKALDVTIPIVGFLLLAVILLGEYGGRRLQDVRRCLPYRGVERRGARRDQAQPL
jgi:hypothetical protein